MACFSQSVEEQIYTATERFNQQPNKETLNVLDTEIAQFENSLKTKDEYFAFINLLVNKAYFLSENNKQRKAISTYEKAHQLYIKHNIESYDIVEYCLIPLAILYHKTNAYLKAEHTIKHYMVLAKQQGNTKQWITGSINLAKLYQSLSKHQTVIDITNKALMTKSLKAYQKQRLNAIKRRSQLLLNTGQNTLLLDENLVLPNLATKSLDDLQLHYEIALKNKNYDTAQHALNQINNIMLGNKLTTRRANAKLSFQEAQLLFLLNKNNDALKKLNQCLALLIPNHNIETLPSTTDLYPENTFIEVFDLLAELQTEPKRKLQCYNLSFYVASSLENEIVNEESLMLSASINRNRSEKCISILHQLFQQKNDSSYIEQAIYYAELHKASVLKSNAYRRQLLQNNAADTLLVKENELSNQQKQLTTRLLNKPSNQYQLKTQDSIRLSLINISIELKRLQEHISKTYWQAEHNRINIDSLQEKLNVDNATLVEYFYGKYAIYQFIFSGYNYEFNKIDIQASTNKSVAHFIDYFNNASMINNNIADFTKDAFLLYKLLKFDLVNAAENVVIIPDGLLNFIPFEALLSAKTTTTRFSKMPFVVKQQVISYNSTISFYLKPSHKTNTNELLGIFPIFENSDQQLTYSIDEARHIEEQISSMVLMRSRATKQAFLDNARSYSILHLSTHASGGTFLKPASISFYDKELFVNDIYNLNIKPNLVVLSACETGIGKLHKGEGAISIARGFQYAGAQNILFSLWQINDLSTSKIMQSFYKHYRKTESAAYANSQSKIDYLSNTNINNSKQSPYYWSAFVFYGDVLSSPLLSVELFFLCIGIGFFLIIVFLAFKPKRKNARYTKRFSF